MFLHIYFLFFSIGLGLNGNVFAENSADQPTTQEAFAIACELDAALVHIPETDYGPIATSTLERKVSSLLDGATDPYIDDKYLLVKTCEGKSYCVLIGPGSKHADSLRALEILNPGLIQEHERIMGQSLIVQLSRSSDLKQFEEVIFYFGFHLPFEEHHPLRIVLDEVVSRMKGFLKRLNLINEDTVFKINY